MKNDDTGAEAALTVESAADRLVGLLSGDEEAPPDESPDTDPDAVPEGEPEEPKEPDEENQPEGQPEPTVKVKVDGEEVEVTLEELKRGYSRTSDYTRKTQKLAEERKEIEATKVSVREQNLRQADYLTRLETALKSMTPEEPNWAKLQEEDPEGFPKEWAAWQQHEKRMTAVAQERERAQTAVARDMQEQFARAVESERERLVENLPEWKDPEKAKSGQKELVDYLKGHNFSEEDLSGVTDHRVVLLLRKAMLFDKAQSQRPKLVQSVKAAQVAKPGSTSTPSNERVTQARQRLGRSGRVDDAAALIEQLLPH